VFEVWEPEMSKMAIDSYGNKIWRNTAGKLHRLGGPAHIDVINGYSSWYINGKLHRSDGPAL